MKIVQELPTKILIVDDDQGGVALAGLLPLLSPLFKTFAVPGGREAIEWLEEEQADIVLSDLVLSGGMDGVQLTAAISRRWPQIKVIVFSGKDPGKKKFEVLNAGAVLYFAKPIHHGELSHAIQIINDHRRKEHFGSQFRTLTEVARDLQATLDFGELAEGIVDGAIRLGFDRARLYLLDEIQNTLIGKTSRGMNLEIEGYAIPLSAGPIIVGVFAKDRPTVWDQEALRAHFPNDDPEPWLSVLGLERTQWIDCPLIIGNRRIGTLSVDHRDHPGHFGYLQEDVQVMGMLAGLAAHALNNAQLFLNQRLANSTLSAIVKDSPDAVVATDLRGKITLASQSIKRLSGTSPEQFVGRQAEDCYTDDSGSAEAGRKIAKEIMAELQGGRIITNKPVMLRTAASELNPVLLSVSLLHDSDDVAVGTVGALKEPAANDQQTERYRSLLDGFGLGTLLLDEAGRITFANRKALRLLQRGEEALQSTSLFLLVPDWQRDSFERACARVMATAAEQRVELNIALPAGNSQTVRADLSPHRAGGRVVGIQVALYSSKELTALLHSGRLMALGEMLASVAHEVNNPLNNLILAYRNLAEELAEKSVLAHIDREELGKIESNADRITQLIRRLRNFARAGDFTPEAVAVAHLVDEALALFGSQIRHHQIEVEVRIPENLPLVRAEPTRIQQVLINLLTNAIDAMEGSRPRRIAIRAYRAADDVALIFEDSGPGIPESIKANLFDPFVSTKIADRGTGLGLAISRSILELHGGSIELAAGTLGGACFEIRLPEIEEQENAGGS